MLRAIVFYLVWLFVIVCGINNLVKKLNLSMPSNDWLLLQKLNVRKYESVTLGLESYRGVMLAANILDEVNLYSIEDSYFPKIEFNPDKITEKNPLLITKYSCLMEMAIDFISVTNNLFLVSKVRQPDKNFFSFAKKPYCSGMKIRPIISGFSGIKDWGTWSEGTRTEFTVEASKAYPNGGVLMIAVTPIINSKIINDRRLISVEVDGKPQETIEFTSSDETYIPARFNNKEPGSNITVVIKHINPIRLSDLNGNDPRTVSLGFISASLLSNNESNWEIPIKSLAGTYGRESDGKNWWHWVERKLSFKLGALFISHSAAQTKVHFEYGARTEQTLALRFIKHDGSIDEILLPSNGDILSTFDKVIDLSPIEISEISIETDGKAYQLSDDDPRIAAFLIRNLDIQSQLK